MTRSIAVAGGGIAGLAAAYELLRQTHAGRALRVTLIEASHRCGGIVETVRRGGFVVECGPDGWVTEKPWARELAVELGLERELMPSNDATRVTWVLRDGKLSAIPDGMRMMVPENLDTLAQSDLFSPAARAAYAEEPGRAAELKATCPSSDESVASFVERHFGAEVSRVLGAPLLGGVFGGDVHRLSVRAVMPSFVQMERQYGSLILALQARSAQHTGAVRPSTFTTLRRGTGALVEELVKAIPPGTIRLNTKLRAMHRTTSGWLLTFASGEQEAFDHVLLATPVAESRRLLQDIAPEAADLLRIPSSAAVIAAFGFAGGHFPTLPNGFGFLAPSGAGCALLAGTFADQKFPSRVPPGGKLIRAYFGGGQAEALLQTTEEEIAAFALRELEKVLGTLPHPQITVVRRWRNALPQYEVGHMERMASLDCHVDALGALHLLGNAYRGVGLPDLVRDARAAARHVAAS